MRVLVFGSHPDDIEIGMGGTVAKHSRLGDTVLMAVATVPSKRERRVAEAEEGARILGARLILLDIDPDQLAHDRKTIQVMDRTLSDFRPDLIYTHWDQDSHQDHNSVSRSVISAARENRCSLLMYEQTIPGGIVPGGFKAQSFVDVSEFIDLKLASILAHKSQMEANGDWWLQGVKGRAMYRGYQIHTKYAEAFEVVKEIEMQFRHRQ
jgi:LmbE family N-acetylglucosaminyl deacetylase